MRLLECNNDSEFSLTKDFVGGEIPEYAILSHTWGADTEEVTYRDLMDGTGKNKTGYQKIRFCGKQASQDHIQYFWVDTCCIDKTNNTELAEAINSMFRWYRDAAKCYVYLSDVPGSTSNTDNNSRLLDWERAFRESKWFTRGWTLQELIAPPSVELFCSNGNRLGDKKSLEGQLHKITRIPVSALQGTPLSEFSFDERISWAQGRETKREEDEAYSLLGILDISMPVIYGEGREKALRRLKREWNDQLHELSTVSQATSSKVFAKTMSGDSFFKGRFKRFIGHSRKDSAKSKAQDGSPKHGAISSANSTQGIAH
jgi:hypothetical protein